MSKERPFTPKELDGHLTSDYATWKKIYEEGCSDPNWEDGTNLNLVRSHILYGKMQCEKILGDNLHLYPDSYFFPDPIKVPNNFMAVSRKLNCRGAVLDATRVLPYSEAVKFYWGECFID